jgi:hypothetical protein
VPVVLAFLRLDSGVPVNKNNKKPRPACPIVAFSVEASPMATNDLNPLFFSDHAEEPEQLGIGKAWDTAATSSRILKTNIPILVVTAAAVFLAMLLVENPLPLFANGLPGRHIGG